MPILQYFKIMKIEIAALVIKAFNIWMMKYKIQSNEHWDCSHCYKGIQYLNDEVQQMTKSFTAEEWRKNIGYQNNVENELEKYATKEVKEKKENL